jgi:hypothetical protein
MTFPIVQTLIPEALILEVLIPKALIPEALIPEARQIPAAGQPAEAAPFPGYQKTIPYQRLMKRHILIGPIHLTKI